MALHYPEMPLNVQISLGYSRFLDLHVYNISAVEHEDETYTLCRVLAYKEVSSFSYTPACSNIYEGYKHAVVPVSLHRIHTKNILQADIDNHLHFMYKILQSRLQDPVQVKKKARKYFLKRAADRKPENRKEKDVKDCCVVQFDRVTSRHIFIRSLLRRSLVRMKLMHKSGRSLGSLLCPKRKIIRVLSSIFHNPAFK